MAGTDAKVEVRFGDFSCSIEGTDDPAERMREILEMVQQIIRETPALADRGPRFGAAEVARIEAMLDGRPDDGDGDDDDDGTDYGTDYGGDDGPGDAGPEDAVAIAGLPPRPPAGEASPGPPVVNIFAPRGPPATVPSDADVSAPTGSGRRDRADPLGRRGGGDA